MAGVRAESVQVTQSAVGDVITVVSGGRSGVSNAFTVGAGALDHFTYTTQPVGPYLAGAGIVVRIEARDVYDNLLTGYTQGVVVSDSTGTVSEGTPNSGDTVIAFSGGVYNNALAASLFITKAQGGVQLTVSDSGKVGTSNAFAVNPAVLHHFGVGAIGGQVADTAFNVVITAYDVYNNVLSSGVNNFNGAGNTVAISDSTGTVTPVVSGVFTAGVRTQSVQVTLAQSNVQITVVDSVGGLGERGGERSIEHLQRDARDACGIHGGGVERGEHTDADRELCVHDTGDGAGRVRERGDGV